MNEYDIGNHLEFYGYEGWPEDFDPEFEACSAVWIEDQEEEEQPS